MHYQYVTVVVVVECFFIFKTLFCAHSFSLSLDIGTLRSHSPLSVSVLLVSVYDMSAWHKPTTDCVSFRREDRQNTLRRNG